MLYSFMLMAYKIAVLDSLYTKAYLAGKGKEFSATRGAEVFLRKLGYEYEVISDSQLEAGISPEEFRVLILPSSSCLSWAEIESIRNFFKKGGSVVATWDTGSRDERGVERAVYPLSDVLGVIVGSYYEDPGGEVKGRAYEFIWYYFKNLNDPFFVNLKRKKVLAATAGGFWFEPVGARVVGWWMDRDKTTVREPAIAVYEGKNGARSVYIAGYPFLLVLDKSSFWVYMHTFMLLRNVVDWALGKNGLSYPPNLTPVPYADKLKRATWIWDSVSLILNENNTQEFLKFARAKGIKRAYLYTGYSGFFRKYRKQLRKFVRACTENGIEVESLDGWPEVVLPSQRRFIYAAIKRVADYNSKVKPEERIVGVHLDIEPHGISDYALHKEKYLRYLIETAKGCYQRGKKYGLRVAYDIIATYEEQLEFNGVKKNVAYWLIDNSDYVALMDYYDKADLQISFAKDEIEYAQKVGKQVVVGSETLDLVAMQMGSSGNTYHEEGEIYMERQIQKIWDAFREYDSFWGVAVHEYFTYLHLSRYPVETPQKPAPPILYAEKMDPARVKIDGSLKEWAKKYPIVVDKRINVVYGVFNWEGPADLSATGYYGWDEEGDLYVAAVFKDQKIVQPFAGVEMWRGDHLEIWMDLDLSDEGSDFVSSDDFQIGLTSGDFSKTPPAFVVWYPKGFNKKVDIKVAARKTKDGYVIEAKIPLRELYSQVDVGEGKRIRITFDPSDTDDPHADQEVLMSVSPRWQKATPSTWAYMVFK